MARKQGSRCTILALLTTLILLGCQGLSTAPEREARAAGSRETGPQAPGVRATDTGSPSAGEEEEGMKGNVKRDGTKVWIEGVPTLSWGASSDTTFAGAMEAALAVTDHPYSATQIMGYSGLAFRVRWAADGGDSEKGWCPSIPVGEFPEEQAAVARATGWRFDTIDEMADEQNPRMGRYADRIAGAIDAGMPVVGYPDKDDLNVAVAYGYEGSGTDRKFLWRTYWSGAEARAVPAADTGPWVIIPIEFGGAPDARQRLLDALGTAVRNWRREGSESGSGYRYAWGERALEAWREDLRRADEFTEEQRKGLFFANWWNFEIWQDARARAAAFLRDEADHLGPEAREALLQAAELYGQEAGLLQAQLGKHEAFLGPWSGKGFGDWTPAVRQRERQILAEALSLERQAVARIQETLPGPSADVRQMRPQVLLDGAVANFRHIAENIAGHRIELCVRGAAEDVYPQPYCYLTTLLVQMHAVGWKDVDLDTLAVVSGASAMFGYEPGEFMPKYAFHHRRPSDLVAQATGYGTESVPVANAEEAWELVRESVDSGRPVAGWHGELMLVAGYQDADAAGERKVFAMKDGDGYFAEWWDWDEFAAWVGNGQRLTRHSGRVAARPEREVALRVIRDLVNLSAGVPESIQEAFPKATFGLAGINAWAADCADVAKHENWSMCHPENPQWTVRNSSAAYLERVAERGFLSGRATEHVRRASERYRSAYRSWQEAYGLVGYPAPEGSGKVKENRLAAARAVRQALEHETAAIAELKEALAAEGGET